MRRQRLWIWTVVCLLGLALACFVTTPAASAQDSESEGQEESAPTTRGPRTGAGEEGGRRMAGPGSPRGAWDPVAMQYPVITWAALQFECGASAEEIGKLRPVYQEVRSQLEEARTKARETRDFAAVTEAVEKAKQQLETKLGDALNEDQKASMKAWEEACGSMAGSAMGARRAGGGRRADMFYLDRTWSYLAFDLKLGADELAKLEPAYKAAWGQRKAVAKGDDAAAIADAAESVRTSLESALKETLTSEQWTKMEEDMAGGRRAAGMRGAGAGAGGTRGPRRTE